jgi:SnoaL-like domain
MSQENVELRSLAEAAFGALNSRNLDGFMAVAAEDVEFTSMIAEVEGTTFRGHDGIRTWWETVVGAFGEALGGPRRSRTWGSGRRAHPHGWHARRGSTQPKYVACGEAA